MSEHKDLPIAEIHIIQQWEYADASARTGASGFVAADRGKVAKQIDNNSWWVLTATTPTWSELTGTGATSTFLALTDVDPASYSGQGGNLVAVNGTPDGLEFITPPAGDFLNLTDVDPSTYSGQAGQLVAVNSTPDGLEFITPAAGNFLNLTDVDPSSYSGQAGRHVRVNATPDALEFADPTLLEDTDTPSSYSGQAGLLLRVNATPDAVEFVDHEALTAIHLVNNYSYANAAARTGASGFVAGDIGKVAHQTDDDSYWILIATTPTWTQITGAGGDVSGPGASTDNAVVRWDGTAGTALLDSTNIINDDGSNELTVADAVTAAASEALAIGHNSSGTPATGFGTEQSFKGETTTTVDTLMGALAFLWRTATHASRQAAFSLGLYRIAELIEVIRIEPPDVGTSSAPNARGAGAVEIQTFRDNVDQVASGDFAAILGGQLNLASGAGSVVAGGEENDARGQYAGTLGGWLNDADGDRSIVLGGELCDISSAGDNGVILAGEGSQVSARSGIALGWQARADIQGMLAHADENFATVGDAETVRLNLHLARAAHTSTTWYELFIDGSAVRFTINADTVYTVKVIITGATSGMAQTWGYKIDAVIRNAGGTTTIDAGTVAPIFQSDTNYDARLTADDTNDALLVEISRTGGVDYNIRWHAAITAGRVGYP